MKDVNTWMPTMRAQPSQQPLNILDSIMSDMVSKFLKLSEDFQVSQIKCNKITPEVHSFTILVGTGCVRETFFESISRNLCL